MSRAKSPAVLALSRQNTPVLEGSAPEKVAMGAYVLQDCDGTPDAIIVGTGTEVTLCAQAKASLAGSGLKVRVVSMPCWELFEEQSAEYKASIFLSGVPCLSVEAAAKTGWERYSHAQIGMETYGASGKGSEVYAHFGFTAANVASAAQQLAAFFQAEGRVVPALCSFPRFNFAGAGHA